MRSSGSCGSGFSPLGGAAHSMTRYIGVTAALILALVVSAGAQGLQKKLAELSGLAAEYFAVLQIDTGDGFVLLFFTPLTEETLSRLRSDLASELAQYIGQNALLVGVTSGYQVHFDPFAIRFVQDSTVVTLAETAVVAFEGDFLAGEISPAPLLEVQREEMELAAAHKELSQRRATLYPTVSLFGSVSGNQGEAYNTDSDISRFYASAGLVVRFSVFDGSRWTDEAIAKVQLRKQEKKLAATKIELHALADNLRKKLPVVNRSIALAEQSVKNDEELLSIARVAHASGRMTTEDYLHYESQLLAAEAALYQARQEYWQILAQKAVLYGTDLRGVVR